MSLAVVTCGMGVGVAQAALGGWPQRVGGDAVAAGTVVARQHKAVAGAADGQVPHVRWQEATGTEIIEWLDVNQRVFAVHWRGPLQPDLHALLGRYFGAYQDAVRRKRDAGQRGGVIALDQAEVVVRSRGRMGQFEGHAYVPDMVPAGVRIEELLP